MPTNQDLAGFWDMVYIQVEHIHALFAELDTIRKNNWKKPEVNTEGNKLVNVDCNSEGFTVPEKLSVVFNAYYNYPTEHFAILKCKIVSTNNFYQVQKCRWTDFLYTKRTMP